MWYTMDSKYVIVFMSIFVTIITDCVFSQVVNNTGCVTNSWHKKWKSCYMKHCGSDPGTCISSTGTPVCRRVKDNCGMCVKRWFVDNQVIQCERTTSDRECPPNVILRNCQNSLCNNGCPDRGFAGARCRVNRCGDCIPEYFVEGLWLMCPSSLPFSPIAGNNELTGLSFFHPEVAGAAMNRNSLPMPSLAAAGRDVGIPQVARAVDTSTSFRSAGPGDVAEPTICRRGVTERTCPALCDAAQCENYPNAVCRVNTCGVCRAEFFIGQERVNCQGQKCPDGVTYFHTCDSCAYNYCHNHPTAECRMDACGKCTATFWLNNSQQVKCVAQNILDPCPNNEQRYVCEDRVCRFDTCPKNSSVSCIVNNCGGCRPNYIHKLTKAPAQCPGYWTRYENTGGKGHAATTDDINRARAQRDRQLRQSQVVLGNTGSRLIEPVNQVGGVPDVPSIPQSPLQTRPTGSGQNEPRGFMDAMADLGPGQADPNFGLLDMAALPQRPDRPSGSASSVFSDMNRRQGSAFRGSSFGESPMPTGRQSGIPLPLRNIPTQDAQIIVPVVSNSPGEPLIVKTEQVPAIDFGLTDSLPTLQQQPTVPVQSPRDTQGDNTQANAAVDKAIENLDAALRKAHPPMDRLPSPPSRPLGPQSQPALNSHLSADAMRTKPALHSSKQAPAKPLVETKIARIPLSSHTTGKPSLQKTKSGRTKPKHTDRNVKNVKPKETTAAKKAPSKPERKTVPFRSLMFPTSFFNIFQTLSDGSAFAIPNQMIETNTKKMI